MDNCIICPECVKPACLSGICAYCQTKNKAPGFLWNPGFFRSFFVGLAALVFPRAAIADFFSHPGFAGGERILDALQTSNALDAHNPPPRKGLSPPASYASRPPPEALAWAPWSSSWLILSWSRLVPSWPRFSIPVVSFRPDRPCVEFCGDLCLCFIIPPLVLGRIIAPIKGTSHVETA